MGNCLCIDEDSDSERDRSRGGRGHRHLGHRNEMLVDAQAEPELSDDEGGGYLRNVRAFTTNPSITRTALNRKRGEFWDTQPFYGGNRMVWDTLKAVVEHPSDSEEDRAMQWLIIEGAELKLPYKCLIEVYDSLGEKYELPNYILRDPMNVLEDGAPVLKTGAAPEMAEEPRDNDNDNERGNGIGIGNDNSNGSNNLEDANAVAAGGDAPEPPVSGADPRAEG